MREREYYSDSSSYIHAQVMHRRRTAAAVILTTAALVLAVLLFIYRYFQVKNVTVVGSTHYSDAEIADMVMDGPLGRNSFVLHLRYRNKKTSDIPFVERMDVDIINHETIRITVYERSVAGYVKYLGRYMYFSRDGTIVETSDEPLGGVPEVLGLKYDRIILYEKLPVSDDAVFGRVLNAVQIMEKYGLQADKIYFDPQNNMTIYFGQIRAALGQDQYTDEKISNISRILPELAGKEGTLEMENYNPGNRYIAFRLKRGTIEEEQAIESGMEGTVQEAEGETAVP